MFVARTPEPSSGSACCCASAAPAIAMPAALRRMKSCEMRSIGGTKGAILALSQLLIPRRYEHPAKARGFPQPYLFVASCAKNTGARSKRRQNADSPAGVSMSFREFFSGTSQPSSL